MKWLRRISGRLIVRLLLVNLLVLLIPVAGLEFARIHERQLLDALERDMRNQSVIVARELEETMRNFPQRNPRQILTTYESILSRSAETTRTRIRLLDGDGVLLADSHRHGPPEGPERDPPTLLPGAVSDSVAQASADLGGRGSYRNRGMRSPNRYAVAGPGSATSSARGSSGPRWSVVAERKEVLVARGGQRGAYTRVRDRAPGVILFVTEPVRARGDVQSVVYVTRSTVPVMEELYKIRKSLIRVLAIALFFTLILTGILAFSISRPLSKLVRAARRITRGERDVEVPVSGSGEVRELCEAFGTMTTTLTERQSYITRFAADVAHEFKSPLTSIRGAAELLSEGPVDDATSKRFLGNIELDVDRLDRLVSRLLELSRIDAGAGEREAVQLLELARVCAQRVASPTVSTRVIGESEISIKARRGDVETAILNLLDNGVRASAEGGEVRVIVGQQADRVRVVVEDDGDGVPEERRAKVFERFFTTESQTDGTGLGLAIVESVARAHGGKAWVEAAESGGARFVMEMVQTSARPS